MLELAQSAGSGDGSFDVDPVDQVVESVEGILTAVFDALPNLVLGLVVLGAFWLVARAARNRLEPRLAAARTKSFGRVFSRLAGVGIIFVGVLVALPIALPAVDPTTALGALGVLTLAAGFAFQDIASNLMSGILLIMRQPFRSGDQIEVDGIRGAVQLITIRETQIRTFDGREVYVPNADVYQNAIEVQTAHPRVRSSVLVGVGYEEDLGRAREVALATLGELEGVQGEPAPQAYYTELGASAINLDLRYWTGSAQAEIRRVQDRVVEAINTAFTAEGIDIPYDIVTVDGELAVERP